MFSPAEGDLLLHGKLQKMNGPVPDVTASSPTTTAQPHLATGLVQLTNGDFISHMWSGRKVEYLGGAMFGVTFRSIVISCMFGFFNSQLEEVGHRELSLPSVLAWKSSTKLH